MKKFLTVMLMAFMLTANASELKPFYEWDDLYRKYDDSIKNNKEWGLCNANNMPRHEEMDHHEYRERMDACLIKRKGDVPKVLPRVRQEGTI